jgi:hypothetical protein
MKAGAILAGLAISLALSVGALAKPPKGAIRGQFTIGILAKYDDMTKYMRWSNVWCVWRGDHIIVHVSASMSPPRSSRGTTSRAAVLSGMVSRAFRTRGSTLESFEASGSTQGSRKELLRTPQSLAARRTSS